LHRLVYELTKRIEEEDKPLFLFRLCRIVGRPFLFIRHTNGFGRNGLVAIGNRLPDNEAFDSIDMLAFIAAQFKIWTRT